MWGRGPVVHAASPDVASGASEQFVTDEERDTQQVAQLIFQGPILDGQESALTIIDLLQEAGFSTDAKVLA